MVARGTGLPKKIKPDAIIEVVLEVRFDADVLPEVVLGRLADCPTWAALQQRRLPAAEIPGQLRQIEPKLRYQPILEMYESGETPRALRIGPKVLSYHRTKKYVGWNQFRPELEQVATDLFQASRNPRIERLGLRYINALQPNLHNIGSISELDLSTTVAGAELTGSFNLNYMYKVSDLCTATVRVATPDFVQGALPEGTSVYVDIDVYTNDGASIPSIAAVKQWIVDAHAAEKTEFFHLLRQPTIDALKEE